MFITLFNDGQLFKDGRILYGDSITLESKSKNPLTKGNSPYESTIYKACKCVPEEVESVLRDDLNINVSIDAILKDIANNKYQLGSHPKLVELPYGWRLKRVYCPKSLLQRSDFWTPVVRNRKQIFYSTNGQVAKETTTRLFGNGWKSDILMSNVWILSPEDLDPTPYQVPQEKEIPVLALPEIASINIGEMSPEQYLATLGL